jgi:hypothetical protein
MTARATEAVMMSFTSKRNRPGRPAGTARVLLAGVTVVFLITGCGSGGGDSAEESSASSSSTVPATGSTVASAAPALSSGYLPLFPFSGPADVTEWQQAYRSGGHQPWHLDAGETAVAFARALGYNEVDRATSSTIQGDDAKIGVGWVAPEEMERPATVAVVHLKRFGTDEDSPWEVVGTEDTSLSLTTPAYGSTAASPTTVGGRITGVDESLIVTVHAPDQTTIGRADPIPGGGQNQPWSTKVSFTAQPGQVLTIAVCTGGHLRQVERFAVTGIRVRG